MKKKNLKKLTVTKETLRGLEDLKLGDRAFEDAVGGQSGTCVNLSFCTCTHTKFC